MCMKRNNDFQFYVQRKHEGKLKCVHEMTANICKIGLYDIAFFHCYG